MQHRVYVIPATDQRLGYLRIVQTAHTLQLRSLQPCEHEIDVRREVQHEFPNCVTAWQWTMGRDLCCASRTITNCLITA